MKVLFLDVDGVLNCKTTKARCDHYIGIDRAKVRLLKQIIDETNAKIVLSSTWRLGYVKSYHGYEEMQHSKKYLEQRLNEAGLSVYDVTPDLGRSGWARADEIKQWISNCKEQITNIAILDDEDFYWYKNGLHYYWVKTSWEGNGLTEDHVKEAIMVLGEKYDHRITS
jgi:hypothetical protein